MPIVLIWEWCDCIQYMVWLQFFRFTYLNKSLFLLSFIFPLVTLYRLHMAATKKKVLICKDEIKLIHSLKNFFFKSYNYDEEHRYSKCPYGSRLWILNWNPTAAIKLMKVSKHSYCNDSQSYGQWQWSLYVWLLK